MRVARFSPPGLVVIALVVGVLMACLGASASLGKTVSTAAGSTLGKTCSPTPLSSLSDVRKAQQALTKAVETKSAWDGPTTGPKAQKKGALVVFIPSNSSNVGDTAVGAGFVQAAHAIGWKTKVISGGSTTSNNVAAFDQAMALHPAGIAVSSFDPTSLKKEFAQAKADGIAVVGNHTGTNPGPQPGISGLFTNVTSNPQTIASIATDCAIVASKGTAGVTIGSCGSEFVICQAKETAMENTLKKCSGCSLLAVHNFPFEDVAQQYGQLATSDEQRFGSKLTYMLTINDIYYDAAIPALKGTGVGPSGPPLMIAAGDGSPSAFQRIREGQYQIATVAEPLNMHGWQMADEMNRALAHKPPSGYVTYPHLVVKANVNQDGGKQNTYNPPNDYKQHYEKTWGV